MVLITVSHSSKFVNLLLCVDVNKNAVTSLRTSLETAFDKDFVVNVVIIPFNRYFNSLITSL